MTNQETLFVAQGGLRVDSGGATGWKPAGYERNGGEEDGHDGEGDDVVRADSVEKAVEEFGYGERSGQT